MTDKVIKNECWFIKHLVSKVENGEIYKPKYQRKRKWDRYQIKENIPSEKEYIVFLFDTYNSVHAITFGQDSDKLSNIDGNNRINAIIHFLNKPFDIFPEKMSDYITFIQEQVYENEKKTNEAQKAKEIAKKVSNEVECIIKEMTYDEIMTFRYHKYFIDKGFTELYTTHLKLLRDVSEDHIDKLISSMKIKGKDRFDTDVKIMVNIFSGYTTEELAELFSRINQYNSGLTEQEALASRLFNIINFVIYDKLTEYEIKQHIKQYYHDRNKDEILNCYLYNNTNETINAYDFMVGFQNYANKKCDLILKTDDDGLSLFFKIFKAIFKGSFDVTFTSENANRFVEYILKTIDILQKIKTIIFMENLVGGTCTLFDTANKKLKSLKKNNMYLIITSIIGYINLDTSEEIILRSIETCILYHFFVNSIKDKEMKDQYKLYDTILYEAGGSFIDNKAKEYLKQPNLICMKITKEIMTSVLGQLIQENVNNRDYEVRANGKDKYDKRRSRKFHEKVLVYYYYKCKIPTEFLTHNFWIEHIFPFSCSWDNQIDIDRLGNIFPILESLNRERCNKPIDEYNKSNKPDFIECIKNIIPTTEVYKEIVSHNDTKPHIFNSEGFNTFCLENEAKITDCFLTHIFSK